MQLKDKIQKYLEQNIVVTKGILEDIFANNTSRIKEFPIALQELEEEGKVMKIYTPGVSPERATREQTYYALRESVYEPPLSSV